MQMLYTYRLKLQFLDSFPNGDYRVERYYSLIAEPEENRRELLESLFDHPEEGWTLIRNVLIAARPLTAAERWLVEERGDIPTPGVCAYVLYVTDENDALVATPRITRLHHSTQVIRRSQTANGRTWYLESSPALP